MIPEQRNISILGATGSIGTQTLDVLNNLGEAYQLRWITCNTRWQHLDQLAQQHKPFGIAIRDEEAFKQFKQSTSFTGQMLCGDEGLVAAAADEANDVVMSAMVGFSGVLPTMAAINAGKTVALANKETLVSAGQIIMPAVANSGSDLIAVDSEHSAILQCLVGEKLSAIQRLVITASGGPFRTTPAEDLYAMNAAQALQHPNWQMGDKITIDSSTLMNKGFEVIEARWLFDIPAEKIDVVVHPQSIIHSLVEFVDGSVKAQLGVPTMEVPIQYALTYPSRKPLTTKPLNLAQIQLLTFEEPDVNRFPCLKMAYESLREGGSAGCVLNAANEVAVYSFISGDIPFGRISEVIAETIEHMECVAHPSLDAIVEIDAEARAKAHEFVSSKR